jgi:S1-C subfamily serine protease
LADELSLPLAAQGVVLTAVEAKSHAARNAFEVGDMIVAVAGQPVESSRDLARLIAQGGPAQVMTVNRKGRLSTRLIGAAAGQERKDLLASRHTRASSEDARR